MNSIHAERADAYVHGLLAADEVARFERELGENAELRAALELARRRQAALEAALPPAEASEILVQATLARVTEHERRRRRRRRQFWSGFLTPVAAAALIIGLFQLHFQNLAASPANLEILGQSRLLPGSDGALRIRLTDARTHAAMANVPVEVALRDPRGQQSVTLATFTTDGQGNGQPSFRLPDWADGQYELFVSARTPVKPEVLTQRLELRRSARLMLTTDKPKYQPGQTIHMRSLTLLRPLLKPADGVESVFTVTDPKGNVIFRQTEKTSRFGIAAVDCELADEIIEGNYTVHCRVGDTDSSVTVEIHKYVLPKMKITVATERPWYLPGEEIRGTINAAYIHGEPVADGEWTLDVRSREAPDVVLAQSKGRTGLDGSARFLFRIPDKLLGGRESAARLNLEVMVRDRAGQRFVKTGSCVVAAQSLKFDVIPESGRLVFGVPNTVFVYVSTPDGEPAQVKGTATVAGAARELTTSLLGVGRFEITPQAWEIDVALQAADARGRNGSKSVRLVCGQIAPDFLVRTDKAVYSGGESMKLTALAGGVQPVFLDVLKDGQTVRSGLIEIKDGQGEQVFDLPPELFGTLTLCAYRFDGQGFPVRKTRAVYVRPAKQLNIAARPDKPEYRPGERAKIAFSLTDAAGKPVPGALSLSAVDEAVFELLSQHPGIERTFYLLEQELLKPVYTVYPWTPEDDPRRLDADRNQLEQALFASTTRTVDVPRTGIKPPTGSAERWMTASGSSVPLPHTLTGASYPLKRQEVFQQRYEGLERVRMAWFVLAALVVLVLDILLWMYVRWYFVAGVHLVCLMALGLIVMFGTQADATFSRGGFAVKMAESAGMPRDMPSPALKGMAPEGGPAPVRVRERFPETMLWQPQLITDDNGRATLDVDLADSITTWRLSASAVSADGRLGGLQTGLRVFQPFFVDLNLPVSLTRNDEVEIPAVVSSFLPKAQTVELTLQGGTWFELLGGAKRTLELKPREVASVSFRLKVKKVGQHELQLVARATELADAVKRTIEVVPDGRPVEQVVNGTLAQPATIPLDLPADAIEGSGKAIVRIYPSSFSQLVEGLEGIFRLPTGCFEQTSSSLYPNVMALSYLRRTGKSVPEVEAKARQYIHVGYQRLLRFEVAGGGFDWYGNPPANLSLTAYGLMEFRDMAEVHDVDPKLIERTRTWLMSQRDRDGSWSERERVPQDARGADLMNLRTTAYTAWAVFEGGQTRDDGRTRTFMLQRTADSINDPYLLALVCNALLALDPKDPAVQPYLDRLVALKRVSPDGRRTWWELAADSATTFYAMGNYGHVETTALAALAFLKAEQQHVLVRPALAWLADRRGNGGTWGTTQATILALKALLAGTSKAADDGGRTVEILLDDRPVQTLEIPADQAEVMKQIDLSRFLKTGMQRVTLRDRSAAGVAFQLAFRYHVPGEAAPAKDEPLTIELKYDRSTLAVDEPLRVTAVVTNRMKERAPMVMIDLPIPPGFTVDEEELAKLAAAVDGPQSGTFGRYQITSRQLLVYLRGLEPSRPVTLSYTLKPVLAATLTVPPARVYEYYDPSKEGKSAGAKLTVTPRK